MEKANKGFTTNLHYQTINYRFADIFEACKALGKTILFIDEIDAIA